MKKRNFTKIVKLKLNQKTFQMFQDEEKRIAFLELKEDKYYFPEYEDFVLLARFATFNEKMYFNNELRKKYQFMPKVTKKGIITLITTSLLAGALVGCRAPLHTLSNNQSHYEMYALEYALNNPHDFIEDEHALLVKSANRIKLYDLEYLDAYFGYEKATIEDIEASLRSNKKMDEKYLDFFIDFSKVTAEEYPNLDMRIFNEASKIIRVREFTEAEKLDPTIPSEYAFYDYEKKEIVINGDLDLSYGSYDSLVLRHELGHMLNLVYLEDVYGYSITYDFKNLSHGYYAQEALDCILTVEPFKEHYSEEILENVGYPLETNIYRVLLSALPNYSIEDSVSHDITYLEKCMAEYNIENIDPSVIITLIDTQAKERMMSSIQIDKEEFAPIYEYLTKLYLMNNITDNMSYGDIMEHKEYIIETLNRGIQDKNYIDFSIIENCFNSYLEEHNIEPIQSLGI